MAPGRVAGQGAEHLRRVAFLIGFNDDDADAQARAVVLKKSIYANGWSEGRNLRIDVHWANADPARAARLARDIVALKPDLVVTAGTLATAAVQRETSTIPIVFVLVSDPQGSGFVKTFAAPGGNITGIVNYESSLGAKWLQLLKEVSPALRQAGVMYNPKTAPYFEHYLRPIRVAAESLGVQVEAAPVGSSADVERAISRLGRTRAGLIVMTDAAMVAIRKLIIGLAAQHKVPAMYFHTPFVEDGGLMSYGIEFDDMLRRGASFVDRVLRGAKPEDLPVEMPTKFEIAVNMATAKALGLTIPSSVMLRADKVIQ